MRVGKWDTLPQACCQLINDEAIRLVPLFLLIFSVADRPREAAKLRIGRYARGYSLINR